MRWRIATLARVSLAIVGFMWVGPLNGEWDSPVNLSLEGQDATVPEVAVDPSGNATAVWVRFDGSNNVIQASTKPFLGSWQSTPDTISLPYENASDPQIAVDAQGNATAIWARSNGTCVIIQASTKLFGGSWPDVPDDISTPDMSASTPQIAVDPHGNATAVWGKDASASSSYIQSSSKPFGGSWDAPANVVPAVASILNQRPQIVVDKWGNATATCWLFDNPFLRVKILASTKPYGSNWQSTPYAITVTGTGRNLTYPQIAVDGLGDVTVVWQDLSSLAIQASTKTYGGDWQVAENISNGRGPCIAADAYGNVTIAWEGSVGGFSVIQSSTRPHGGSWQATPDSLSSLSSNSSNSKIIADGGGRNLTAVWQESDGSNTVIQASTKLYGGAWPTDPDTISLTGHDASNPQIAANARGSVTAVWQRSNGSHSIVQASSEFFGPTVTGLSPNSGFQRGGNSVTITGTNFVRVSAVSFGSTPAESFSVESPTTIAAVAPPGTGTVDVTVTASEITSSTSEADRYTYLLPTVTGLSPNSGFQHGGNSVTITGTNFVEVSAVSFGSTPAESFSVESPTSIVTVAPPGIGRVDVTVTASGTTSSTSNADWYTYFLPTVTGLSPNSGFQYGGNFVTITGRHFVGVSAVSFGSTPAESFSVESPTTIVTVAPPGIGMVDVTVTASETASSASKADRYTYLLPPSPAPANFKGIVNKNWISMKQWVETTWLPSSMPNVVEYQIFARNKKIKTIPAQLSLEASIQLFPHQFTLDISDAYRQYLHNKYKIRAVGANHTVSPFTHLVVE